MTRHSIGRYQLSLFRDDLSFLLALIALVLVLTVMPNSAWAEDRSHRSDNAVELQHLDAGLGRGQLAHAPASSASSEAGGLTETTARDAWGHGAGTGGPRSVPNLDMSLRFIGGDDWHADGPGLSPERQARIQSCYETATASVTVTDYRSTGYGIDSLAGSLSHIVQDYYSKKRQSARFEDCANRRVQ